MVAMKDTPRPHNAQALQGYKRHYYKRLGGYRVAWEVDDEKRLVVIKGVGDRKDFYSVLERRVTVHYAAESGQRS